jgi:signal transduction histidine kinase
MSHLTSPLPLDQQGLWATLAWQAREFAEHADLRCHWSVELAEGLTAPRGPMASAVSGIFEELLSNVGRHARASEVEIRVSATRSGIALLVKDNGRGAPLSVFDRADSLGIVGMRARAERFGGWLHIDSQPGLGTKVILTVPLYQDVRIDQPTQPNKDALHEP